VQVDGAGTIALGSSARSSLNGFRGRPYDGPGPIPALSLTTSAAVAAIKPPMPMSEMIRDDGAEVRAALSANRPRVISSRKAPKASADRRKLMRHLYRPRFMRHLVEGYAASAAG